MPLDVSVVVPFYNPGPNLEDCLGSLREQTLSRNRFEVVLIDDGSTDGSGTRVDAWVARHSGWATVHHLPERGGPGAARNIGIDSADGRYVQFLDSDDALTPRALERQLEIADSSAADIVIGKLASDFRGIHHPLFRHTVTGRTLDDYPLMLNLTVCKMFRGAFLADHGIRFPEGPHYIEDQRLCIEAYARARSVAVVGDLVCYYYRRRRTGGHHHGDTPIVPSDYYRELAGIFDLVDTTVGSAETRANVLARFYRNEMLGRLRGPAMLAYQPGYREDLVAEVRALATTRFGPEFRDRLPAIQRAQSRLLLDNDIAGLITLAEGVEAIRLRATTAPPLWRDGRLVLTVEAGLSWRDQPLQLERDDAGWLLPQSLAPGTDPADRRLTAADDDDLDLDLATVSFADGALWSTTAGLHVDIDDDGRPHIHGEVELDPATVMGGAALAPGRWGLRLRATVAGLSRAAPIGLTEAPAASSAWVRTDESGLHSAATFTTGSHPLGLHLDIDESVISLSASIAAAGFASPSIGADGRITLPVSGVLGPDSDEAPATLILAPLDEPDGGVVHCRATLRIGPDGAAIDATVPELPGAAGRWEVWLRIGEIGGPPPEQLPVELTLNGSGALGLTPMHGPSVGR